MLLQSSKFLMGFFGRATIHCVCFGLFVVNTKIVNYSLVANSRHPFLAFGIPRHALESTASTILLVFISAILASCCNPQIFPPIIVLYCVSVIYFVFWPATSLHKPNEARSGIFSAVYENLTIAEFRNDASNGSSLPGVHASVSARAVFPNQPPRVALIVQDGPHVFSREVVAVFALLWNAFVSHSIVPQSLWSGAARGVGSATSAPNHYQLAGAA